MLPGLVNYLQRFIISRTVAQRYLEQCQYRREGSHQMWSEMSSSSRHAVQVRLSEVGQLDRETYRVQHTAER